MKLGALGKKYQWSGYPLALFGFSRIALLVTSKIGLLMSPSLFYPGGPREFLQKYPALDGLCRWDCGMYERIAREGYWDVGALNFFPLYPLLVRGLTEITGLHLHLSLLVVSNVASLASFLVIYRIFWHLEGENPAKWALALWGSYPFAFFQAAAFPESLVALTTGLSLYWAIKAKHVRAGLALAFGVLARQLALLAGAGLLVAQIRQRGTSLKQFFGSRALLGLLLPIAALGVYCLYQYYLFKTPFAFWTVRKQWGPLASWTLLDVLTCKDWNAYTIPIAANVAVTALIPTAGTLGLLVRRHFELAAFSGAYLLVTWVVGLWAMGRHSSSCWPAFLPLGVLLARRASLQAPTIIACALCQGLFFYLFSHQFPVM